MSDDQNVEEEYADDLIEKRCSICKKLSWDSEFGSFNETHVNKETGKTEKCNWDLPA